MYICNQVYSYGFNEENHQHLRLNTNMSLRYLATISVNPNTRDLQTAAAISIINSVSNTPQWPMQAGEEDIKGT